MKDISDRMKNYYEDRNRVYLTRRTPVIIRLDGRAFHTYTRGFSKPFDGILIGAMKATTQALVKEIQGAAVAYTQSDEISILVTDWATLTTEAWFDYNIQKMCSVAASFATCEFNRYMLRAGYHGLEAPWAQFDARCFNLPDAEIVNYFLWRAKDWHRNSVTMYAQAHFSHKQLHGRSVSDMHEMLHSIGKNWATDLTRSEKNGTFYSPRGEIVGTPSDYSGVHDIIMEAMSDKDG